MKEKQDAGDREMSVGDKRKMLMERAVAMTGGMGAF